MGKCLSTSLESQIPANTDNKSTDHARLESISKYEYDNDQSTEKNKKEIKKNMVLDHLHVYDKLLLNIEQSVKYTIFGYMKSCKINKNIPVDIIVVIVNYYRCVTSVYCIGCNNHNILGKGRHESVFELTQQEKMNNFNISNIYNGGSHIIYSDLGNKNCFVLGQNYHGQCCLSDFKTPIMKMTKITFWEEQNIVIKNIFCNLNGYNTFWIDINDKMYANGSNGHHQLGLNNDNDNKSEAVHVQINNLSLGNGNIVDIQCANHYTLCLDDNGFVYSTGYNSNYSSSYDTNGGDGHGKDVFMKQFTRIKTLDHIKITKIKTGQYHSLFLTKYGRLYVCGINDNGNLGLGHTDNVYIPTVNNYFPENNIEIKDIQCGGRHSLCLDINGKIYSFGENSTGECGIDSEKRNILIPTIIKTLYDKYIEKIKCGSSHCYARSKENNHYFWGSNSYNECFINPDQTVNNADYRATAVKKPHLVDEILKKTANNRRIKDILLGFYNTQIIFYD